MTRSLPPFRLTPEEWARVHIRRAWWRVAIFSGAVYVLLLWPCIAFLGFPPWSMLLAAPTAALGVLSHYYTARDRLRKDKGLPWEEQRVVLADEGFHSTYESGFEFKIPWTKVDRVRRYPEGLFLEIEGRSQCFLPQSALGPEDEAYLLGRLPQSRGG